MGATARCWHWCASPPAWPERPDVVAQYAQRAEDDLTALPDSAGKRALSALVDHVRDGLSK